MTRTCPSRQLRQTAEEGGGRTILVSMPTVSYAPNLPVPPGSGSIGVLIVATGSLRHLATRRPEKRPTIGPCLTILREFPPTRGFPVRQLQRDLPVAQFFGRRTRASVSRVRSIVQRLPLQVTWRATVIPLIAVNSWSALDGSD